MTLELFISILVISATATSIAVEIIKTLLDKAKVKYQSVPVSKVLSIKILSLINIVLYCRKM